MKKRKMILILILVLVTAGVSYCAGTYVRDKEYSESRSQRCAKNISFAIEKIEEKGLSVDGVVEAVASDIWVAHELCDDSEVSAELNNLWNTLVYDEDTYIEQEDVLAQQLKDLLTKYQ